MKKTQIDFFQKQTVYGQNQVCLIFRAREVASSPSSGKIEFELDGPNSNSKTECCARGSKCSRNIGAKYNQL